jgi:cytidine deaminase
MTIDWEELTRAAAEVQKRAYAPYSRYHVGAAVLGGSGRIYAGCNVENASYGLALCAERSAIAQMIAAADKDPRACVVITPGPIIGTPCGMCRQTLAEFAADLPILLCVADAAVAPVETTLRALLPDAFGANALVK